MPWRCVSTSVSGSVGVGVGVSPVSVSCAPAEPLGAGALCRPCDHCGRSPQSGVPAACLANVAARLALVKRTAMIICVCHCLLLLTVCAGVCARVPLCGMRWATCAHGNAIGATLLL